MWVKQGPRSPTMPFERSYGYRVHLMARDGKSFLGVWHYPKTGGRGTPIAVSHKQVADYLERGIWTMLYPDNVALPEGL